MTISEFMNFLDKKNEHYPISDEFIKKYQQSPASINGYVYYAWETGRVIHKEIAEPNQKWHFFESYILRLLNDKKISLDDPAEKIYGRIKCPELLLWIAEASCIEEDKVKKASKEAQSTIESNIKFARNVAGRKIRTIITWDIIKEKICNSLER